MTSGRDFVRDAIREMSAYTLEKRSADTKLDQNEGAYDFPDELKQLVFERLSKRNWNRYPDFEVERLRSAIAEIYGLGLQKILVGNGSNELILASLMTFVSPGRRVVFAVPTFALYDKIVTIMGGVSVPVRFDPTMGRLPVEEMIRLATEAAEPALFVVCSPNNPTGGTLLPGELDALLATGGFVLLDRAYGEFADDTLPPLHDRLVTFSTFSKAWGLAGLRIGWLAATEENCSEIRKVKLPYNLNAFSEEVAIVALENRSVREARVAEAVSERERMIGAMRALPGVTPYPSSANFIAFETALPPKELFARLYARGVLIRDISSYVGMQSSLRVSVGTPAENDRFIDELRRATAAAPQASKDIQ